MTRAELEQQRAELRELAEELHGIAGKMLARAGGAREGRAVLLAVAVILPLAEYHALADFYDDPLEAD